MVEPLDDFRKRGLEPTAEKVRGESGRVVKVEIVKKFGVFFEDDF